MTTEMSIPCPEIKAIDDKAVIGRIPEDVLAMLGINDGTGYDLSKDRRDIFFERGRISYQPNAKFINVFID